MVETNEIQDIANFCVEYCKKLGASYSEARLEYSDNNAFVMNNGILQASEFGVTKGVGIRIIANKAMGFTSTNRLEKEHLKNVINNCFRSLKASKNLSIKTEFSEEKTLAKEYEIKQKIKLQDVGAEQKISLLRGIEFSVEKNKKNSKITRYIHYTDSVKEKVFMNSEGTKIISKIPLVSLFYIITAQSGEKTIQRIWQLGNSGGFEQAKKWNVEEHMKQELDALTNTLKKGVSSPRGKIDFVVSPEISGIMAHESGGHPYEADRILGREAAQAGESFIDIDMIGTKIGNEIVNIVDDPAIDSSFGYFLYDDEGVPAKKKYLMKNGKINEFMHNRETAKLSGIKSNGCARASSYDREPLVRMSNTYIEPGDHKFEELFEGVKQGVYMKSFMEWNIDDKRLNQKYVGAEAYMIENGKITSPVLMPVLEITTPNLYSSIDAIGKELEFHPGSCGKGEPMQGMPVWLGGAPLRIRNVNVR